MFKFPAHPVHCAGNLDQLFDGTILGILAILVGERARLPSNRANHGHFAPLARRLVYLWRPTLQDCLAILLPPRCNLGLKRKIVGETKIARLLGSLAQNTVENSMHTVLVGVTVAVTAIVAVAVAATAGQVSRRGSRHCSFGWGMLLGHKTTRSMSIVVLCVWNNFSDGAWLSGIIMCFATTSAAAADKSCTRVMSFVPLSARAST